MLCPALLGEVAEEQPALRGAKSSAHCDREVWSTSQHRLPNMDPGDISALRLGEALVIERGGGWSVVELKPYDGSAIWRALAAPPKPAAVENRSKGEVMD